MPSAPSTTILQRVIPALSRTILGVLNRPLLVPKLYTQQFNGSGTNALVLPNWPLLDTPALTLNVSGADITIAPQDSDTNVISTPWGWRYQPWDGLPPGNPAVLELVGGAGYCWGLQNVVLSYTAGYRITGEAATIPATPFHVTPAQPYGLWATDEGVTYAATGVALVAIPFPGTPTIGQYIPPAPDLAIPRLYYTFAAADVAAHVLLSYGFIPADVEQLTIDLIGERLAYRGRIGLRSQSLAGQESIAYDLSGITAYIRRALADYVSVIPPATGASV